MTGHTKPDCGFDKWRMMSMYGMQNGPMKKTEEDCRMPQMIHKETAGRGKHGSLISGHFLMYCIEMPASPWFRM